jgi:hypothetical protein
MTIGIWVRRGSGKGYLVFEHHPDSASKPKPDSVDAAWFLLWLMLAATVVAAVREVVFG